MKTSALPRARSEHALAVGRRRACILIDHDRYATYVDGRSIALTRVEFDILELLARHCNRVVSTGELLRTAIRGTSRESSSLIRVHVCHLRRKLGPAAVMLQTVRGRGLLFVADIQPPIANDVNEHLAKP